MAGRPGGICRLEHGRYCAPDGGFYVTLRLQRDEEDAAAAILRATDALVHPGYFYDIDPHHLVFSFALDPRVIHDVFPRLLSCLDRPDGGSHAGEATVRRRVFHRNCCWEVTDG